MNLMPIKASLLALALFAGPALAGSQLPPGSMIVAQADEDAQGGDKAAAIQKFLANKQKVEKMTDERLAQRLKRARNLLRTKDLSADLQSGLNAEVAELEAEISRRGTAQTAAQPETQAGSTAETTAAEPDTQSAKKAETTANAPVPADAEAFLNEQVQLSSMSVKDLRARFQKAQGFVKNDALPRNVRVQMREIAKAARDEIQSRKSAGGTATDAGNGTAAGTGDQAATTAAAGDNEAKAKAFISDAAMAEKMPNPELRKRLQAMRDLLANGKLSKPTQQALRKQLATDRAILRSRVGNQQGNAGNGNAGNGSTTNNNTTINNTTVNVILKDRRPAKDLTEAELRRRIRVLREAERDNKYNEQDRRFWRETVELDRRFLNQRLRDNRERRRGDLRSGKVDIDINLGMKFEPNRRPPRYVFAAEANEEDLEEILAAPPRREIDRRYTVDEISTDEDVRDAVARIEIDTVRFGFGEGFLREEEIENLETIAEIMERILAAHPDEVFMVEGHTDAVGTAEANLALSRERAAAVKEALVKYFVIPPENIKTVGLGERFLKIPTEEAEAENRRVSVARITALVGELQQ